MRVVSQDIFYCANKKKVQAFSTFSELIIVIFEEKNLIYQNLHNLKKNLFLEHPVLFIFDFSIFSWAYLSK